MGNINKIRLSGQTYNIEDSNATKTISLTQAEYDAIVSGGTLDPNALYIITDAQGADLSNYYTKSETSGATQISTALASKADTATTYTKTEVDNAITAATSTKQDTLVSGTNIKTINNTSILGSGNIDIQGGGGKAVAAGTNISITTGETADTINCTLPITVSKNGNQNEITFNNVAKLSVRGYASGSYAVAIGDQTVSYGNYAIAIGYGAKTNYTQSFSYGYYSITNNQREFSTGSYNNSVTATTTFGDSGNTLFSVGNGTSSSARHNAFEIRQNGDIYCSDGTNDVKLQDTITATAANTTALGGLKLVKLTQSDYDALTTKDDNTVYFIGDSTNGYTMKIGSANVN